MSRDANARGGRPTLGHVRGLDGIRTLSVLGIIAFHSGVHALPGGFYGVDAFFVLSGFLITSLLLTEWAGTGNIRLRCFWARRARRLLPGLFVLVAVIGIVLSVAPRLLATPHVLGDALAALFYVSNWYSAHGGVTYFSLSSQPSPLLHTWSLAIEEQFYLVWPLVVLGVLALGRRRPRHAGRSRASASTRRRLLTLFQLACLGSLGSAALMALLARHGYTSRAYYGTDTRAQALLVGAAIAVGLTLWREGSRRRWFTRAAAILALAGMGGTAALWCTTPQSSTFAFRGGFFAASLAAGAVVLGCAVAPRSMVVRLLELPPLPQWGRISYGIYLWYWPVLLVVNGQRLHWGVLPLFLARVGITVAIAAVSYDLVEMPARRGSLERWRGWVVAPLGAAAAISAVFVSTLVPVGTSDLSGTQLSVSSAPSSASSSAVATSAAVAASAGAVATSPGSTSPGGPVPSTARQPSYLTPGPIGGAVTRPVKVLLVGDSIAGSLGVGLAQDATHDGVQIANEGRPGCSLSMQSEIKVLFYTVPANPPCDVGGDPASLLDTWRRWVDAYNPDVVVYVARGETFDQENGGTWRNLGQPPFDAYVASRFRQAVEVLGSRGAAVVLATTPYYDSGLQPSGAPWPEDDPARVALDNATMRAVAGSTPPGADGERVSVFDLNALVSPDRRYSATVGTVNVRCADGVHFSRSGGIFVGEMLAPELAELGQAHAAAAPGGAWPGALPPSTPSWFPNLPCQ